MIQRLKKMKENKKGFTLVELIVVLVILAILIALLVPALTGYIDKARKKSVAAEARMMLEAIQTEESDAYSKDGYADKPAGTKPTGDMITLSEVKGTMDATGGFTCSYTTKDGAVIQMTFVKKGQTVEWDGTDWK